MPSDDPTKTKPTHPADLYKFKQEEAAKKESIIICFEDETRVFDLFSPQTSIRESALEVQQNLVVIRSTLRYTLGSNHRDYQKLRVTKSRHEADESAVKLETGEPIQESDSADSVNNRHIVDSDTIAQVPLAAVNPSASDDGGNGKGTSAGIAPYLANDTEVNPPSSV